MPGPMNIGAKADQRALAPDLARGVMLLLIVIAHAPLWVVGADPGVGATHVAGGDTLDRLWRGLSLLLVDSRAYPLFAVLFGYGLARVADRRLDAGLEERTVRRSLRSRGRWLLAFGLVHGLLISPVEILGAYGLIALLFAGLLLRDDRALLRVCWILAGVFLVVVPLAEFAFASAAEERVLPLGLLGYDVQGMIVRLASWLVAVVVNTALYPIPLIVLIGVWAGRRRILESPNDHRRLLRRVAMIGLPVSIIGALPLALAGAELWPAGGHPLLTSLHTLSGVAGGLGYAALFGLFAMSRNQAAGPIGRAMVATGRRSLTCYLLQSTLLVVLLSQTFLGLGGHVNSLGAGLIAIVAWAGGVAAAAALEKAGRRGPADALLRRLADRHTLVTKG
jgi:uncharacterized protein